MKVNQHHLTYCSNIHAGETWVETFYNLQTYIPNLKIKLSPEKPFGIGLRLSNQASEQLILKPNLVEFKNWLSQTNCYVFTMNGFPYGDFHGQHVKDQVHRPDWTTSERTKYTLRLADLLIQLLPDGIEGGISTSPLSYKPWWKEENYENVFVEATKNMAIVVEQLHSLYLQTGKIIHLDIEPEPDGLIENGKETINYFEKYLLSQGAETLAKSINVKLIEAKKIILNHIQICYDVCHFALCFENPQQVVPAFQKHGIKIGKVQISAALKTIIPAEKFLRISLGNALQNFVEPTYLHQVSGLKMDGSIHQYRDLPEALATLAETKEIEWRTHFHVPVFLSQYGILGSTQAEIIDVLVYLKDNNFTQHLEIETYTWEVLPHDLRAPIDLSILREYEWVLPYIA